MARQLKVFQTSLGFYDLAVAVPSMKAALEAWGAGSNLFHQGIARQTDDPDVVKAALAKPGMVLKRAAGSSGRFSEHAELPSESAADRAVRRPQNRRRTTRPQRPPPDDKLARKAAAAYEREQKKREAEERRQDRARARARARQDKAIAKARAALDAAQQQYEARAAAIAAERAALDAKAEAEDERWARQKAALAAALRRARDDA